MATVPRDARECACGQEFDHDDADASLTSEEIRIKAEELYENYLAARLEQARKAVQTAQADFARDPSNSDKSDCVASAIREVQQAESAMTAQRARVAEMKKAMLPETMPQAPRPVATHSKKRATTLKSVAVKSQAQIVRKPIPVLTEVVATAPTHVRPKRHTKVAANTAKKSHTVTVASAKPELAPPAVVASAKPELAPPAVVASAKPELAPPAQSATPNPAFRQAQAVKAEKILRAISSAKQAAAPATKTIKEEPRMPAVTEPKPPQAASVPVKSAPRLYTPRDKKDCPNCTALVAVTTTRCRCGYEFSSSEQLIPSLAMSDEERAEFAKLFSNP